MIQRTETKEEIIKLGNELVMTRGINAFSYQHISSALKIRNAAIHYHFPTKEDLTASIIDSQMKDFTSFTIFVSNNKSNEMEKLKAFFKLYDGFLEADKVCLIGSLATDFKTINISAQEKIKEFYQLILNWLTGVLKIGKEKGLFSFDVSPKAKALLITSNMAGGLQVARLTDSKSFHQITGSILREIRG